MSNANNLNLRYCNLNKQQVYMILSSLSQKRILNFIPQKHIPFIRYTQRRELSERLVISPAVYDDLKARFTERIDRMLEYASSDLVCRSRLLLRYFGETKSCDCGICDVCLKDRR